MTPLILFLVLLMVLGLPALGWSFDRWEKFALPTDPGRWSCRVQLTGMRLAALRSRLSCALLLSGLALLLGPSPSAWAAGAHQLANQGSVLTNGQSLLGGDYLVSTTGEHAALMQDDGNFVLYHGSPSTIGAPSWASKTEAGGGVNLTILSGNDQSVARIGTLVSGGEADFAPLSVMLTDSAGNPLVGTVDFTIGQTIPQGMVIELDGSVGREFRFINVSIATLFLVCSHASGSLTIVASGENDSDFTTSTVTFHETVSS